MTSENLEGKAAPPVRRAEAASDQALLLNLFIAARAQHFAPLNLPAPVLDMLMRQQFLAQSASYAAQYPGARREIIEVDGAPIGRMISNRTNGQMRLVDIALAPAWRSKGLGSILITALMDEARATGAALALQVACDNARAAALYDRLGFETIADDGVYREMRWTAAS
ncbi:GNAT family N-acetyltransferase [Caulobacter sp. 602-1]|uniref:GNAT family N-acetyltransferase n=1 Tax=Caulobacter sp. 602-1 TaxID=2492472 RepID=UPI000F63D230|nr:GNAT family N-acetyltransferase [Caulobacter sp. 602-1]RRN64400.1 GNAT family N-acetyltransferase [Caulobacter sp. 602-1]